MILIDHIQAEWEVDSVIDKNDPNALSVDQLHRKYWDFMIEARLALIPLQEDYQIMMAEKEQWMLNPTIELYREKKWDYPLKVNSEKSKILKTEVKYYLARDKDLLALKHQILIVELQIDYVQDILKKIHSRGYLIQSHIDLMKFKNGIGGIR